MRIAMLLQKSAAHDSRARREATALVEAGHEVSVLELAPVTANEGNLDGFRRRPVAPRPWVRRALSRQPYPVAFTAWFVRGILAEHPDAIHVHDAALLLPGLIGRRLTGAALVYESHELATGVPDGDARQSRCVRRIEALAMPRCAATISVNAIGDETERLLAIYHELPARDEARLRRVYSGYLDNEAKRRAWAFGNPGNRAIRSELLTLLLTWTEDRLQAGAELLDVGCGTGWLLRALAESGVDPSRLTGIDELAERAERAQTAVRAATIIHGNAAKLPLSARSFDLVTLVTVLSSMRRRTRLTVLKECARVLRPDGLVLIYEARFPNLLNRATTTVSPREIHAGGLQILARQSLTVAPPIARRLGRWTPWAYPVLARVPALRSHRLIVAAPAPAIGYR